MKRQKVLLTLPDSYLTALDNKIDNILIRTRGDAIISLLAELQKANPKALVFDEKPESIPLPKWLSQSNMDTIKSILIIKDDASEQHAAIVLGEVKTALKAWESVGFNGLKELRAMRAAKKG